MEQINISIPGELYVVLYSQFGDRTTEKIQGALRDLVGDPAGSSHSLSQRPGPGTITGRVWEIADNLLLKFGKVGREEVVQECLKIGINTNTANTQFSYWKKENI